MLLSAPGVNRQFAAANLSLPAKRHSPGIRDHGLELTTRNIRFVVTGRRFKFLFVVGWSKSETLALCDKIRIVFTAKCPPRAAHCLTVPERSPITHLIMFDVMVQNVTAHLPSKIVLHVVKVPTTYLRSRRTAYGSQRHYLNQFSI
mgnify:CR=1 FL=1